ncbi:hypothetical protein AB0M88_40605, partial [Actinoplanes sp. NPDC051411]
MTWRLGFPPGPATGDRRSSRLGGPPAMFAATLSVPGRPDAEVATAAAVAAAPVLDAPEPGARTRRPNPAPEPGARTRRPNPAPEPGARTRRP